MQELAGGTSYCSSHEPVLIFGLGELVVPCTIEVRWPSGIVQTLSEIQVDQKLRLQEPRPSPGRE